MINNELLNQIGVAKTVVQDLNKTRNEIEFNKQDFQFFNKVLSIGLFPVFILLKWFKYWTFWHSVLGTLGFIILCIVLGRGINTVLKTQSAKKDEELNSKLTITLAKLANSNIPDSYRYLEALNAFEQYLLANRANTIGGCIELFEQDKKRQQLTA